MAAGTSPSINDSGVVAFQANTGDLWTTYLLQPSLTLSRLEQTMPAPTRSPWPRPPGAPAYCLGRPAGWQLTGRYGSRPAGSRLPACSGESFSLERNT
jgi:hypothetical protein